MSFGNRSNYCSLKDAFKTFTVDNNQIHNTEQHSFSYKVEQPEIEAPPPQEVELLSKEGFEEECDSVCNDCAVKFKRYGPVGTSLNEILNIILICILLFIVIYKPNF